MYSWELLKRYLTLSRTQQSSFLTCGCFCIRGLIHHTPFKNIKAKPATFDTEKDSHNFRNFTPYSFPIVCRFFNVPSGHFKHVEGTVTRGLRFIVLIREDLKV